VVSVIVDFGSDRGLAD